MRRVESVIESHNLRAVSGEALGGGALSTEVKQRIESCDALVAVATPGDQLPSGRFAVRPWIRDELTYGRAKGLPAVVLLDTATDLGGMNTDHERIDYDRSDPSAAFVKLSQTLGLWKRLSGRTLKIRLGPDSAAKAVARSIDNVRCEYRFIVEGSARPWQDGSAHIEEGGVFAYVRGVPEEGLLELKITTPQTVWRSMAVNQWLSIKLSRGDGA